MVIFHERRSKKVPRLRRKHPASDRYIKPGPKIRQPRPNQRRAERTHKEILPARSNHESTSGEVSKTAKILNFLSLQINYLSYGNDIGNREVKFEGKSDISGPFVVEDTAGENGDVFRRLVFMNNQNIIQSEAKLKSGTRNGREKNYLFSILYEFQSKDVAGRRNLSSTRPTSPACTTCT